MRTTITLDPDVEALVRRAMRERGLSFKQRGQRCAAIGALRSDPPKAAAGSYPQLSMGEARSPLSTRCAWQVSWRTKRSCERCSSANEAGRRQRLDLLSQPNAEPHDRPRRWLDNSLAGNEIGCVLLGCLLAFLRLTTNRPSFPAALPVGVACDQVEDWLTRPAAVVVEPTTRHASILRGLLDQSGTAGNLTTDAHIAALAIEHGAEVVTFDRDFARFGVRYMRPA